MSRILWLTACLMAASTGCGDSPVGPVRGSFSSTMTFVEPTDPGEVGTFCPPSCACGPSTCAGACNDPRCCPASPCDPNARPR
jgi:hypothetical protein